MMDDELQTEEEVIFRENLDEALMHSRQALHLVRRLWPEPAAALLPQSKWNAAAGAVHHLEGVVLALRNLASDDDE